MPKGDLPVAMRRPSANDGDMSAAIWFYVGTYSGPHSKGIYLVRLDGATGVLDQPALAGEATNASFLVQHPSQPLLYAVCESGQGGGVSAFKVDSISRTLTRLNDRPSGGLGPCHVSIDSTGRCVMVANYSSGHVSSLGVEADGSLGPIVSTLKQEGTGPIAARQDHAYAHSIYPDPSGQYALSCDLGADRIFVYRMKPQGATLTANEPASHAMPPGAGPRHLSFSPCGQFVYVINELANTVSALSWDSGTGTLKTLQTIDSMAVMPSTYSEENKAAEIVVHPGGQYVYASNRGEDSIAIFQVGENHHLKYVSHASTQGKGPRSFDIDPTGRYLVAANERTDSLTAFAIDSQTGGLTPTGHIRNLGRPVCVLFCK